ncbi:MAG: type IV pilus assembly protein PilM [Armatimonadetes bacterium]|nr:type IV pilus assembly protein PilM [Armatimonadota bacterium]
MASWRDVFQIGAVAVGLDIGKHAIKAAEIRRTVRGIELRRFGIGPTPVGAIEGGLILDRDALIGAVPAVLRDTKIRGRRVVISVTGQNVLARVLRLPPIPEDEIKQAIRWEAERHLPIPVDDAVLDAQLVREVAEDGQRQIEVLLAAAPEGLVISYIETLDAAHLLVEAVEVGALAMSRALGEMVATGTRALVNLGASTTDLAIVRDGVPQFTRTILSGQEAVARAAAIPQSEEHADAFALASGLDELLTQLRRSLDFYRAQFGGATIDGVVLCGGGARIPRIDRHLALELDLPVSTGTPLVGVELHASVDPKEFNAVAPQLVVATGLAMRTVV